MIQQQKTAPRKVEYMDFKVYIQVQKSVQILFFFSITVFILTKTTVCCSINKNDNYRGIGQLLC